MIPAYPPPVETVLRAATLAFAGFACTPAEAGAYRTLVAAALLEEAAYLFAEAGSADRAAEAISAARHAEGLAIVAGVWRPTPEH
jgi:hypothetical protein